MTLAFKNSAHSRWNDRINDRGDRSNESPEETEEMRKLQFTVASSTFGAIAFIGLFCTCLWFTCYRHKRTSRIRGRTFNTNSGFAIPNGRTLVPTHLYDPQGMTLNPYVITPNYYSDVNSNMNPNSGSFHQDNNIEYGIPDDVKPPSDSTESDNTYRPFFRKPEWDPPEPPSYDTLGFVNPSYETNPPHPDTDHNEQLKKTLISEKVLTSILATCDPSKRPQQPNVDALPDGAKDAGYAPGDALDVNRGHLNVGYGFGDRSHEISLRGGTPGASSAPLQSIVSIDSKDEGHPYPDGVTMPPKDEGKPEELTPPPFNPSYFNK